MKAISIVAAFFFFIVSPVALADSGGFYADSHANQTDPSVNASLNSDPVNITGYSALGGYQINKNWGLGEQYDVNQALGVRLGYDNYGIGNSAATISNVGIGVISAGVVYKF
jgi:hypothetical protein